MFELSSISKGDNVLDLATGIGDPSIAAAEIVKPDGHVTAIDFSPDRLNIARNRAKERNLEDIVTFIESDIDLFEFPTTKFDVAFCKWGLMFVGNLQSVVSNIHKSLLPGKGRLVAAVWPIREKVPIMNVPLTIVERLNLPPLPSAIDPFSLSDGSGLARTLRDLGFSDVKIESVPVIYEFDSPEEYVDFIYETNGGLKQRVASAFPNNTTLQRNVRDAILEEAKSFSNSSGKAVFQNESILISGSRE